MNKLLEFALNPKNLASEQLYFRKNLDSVSFDTYFNIISINKIKKYTNISNIAICIEGENLSHVLLIASDGNNSTTITERKITTNKTTIHIDIYDIPDEFIYIYPKIYLKSSNANISHITAYAKSESYIPINTAVIICTYKREEYVTRNANTIAKYFYNSGHRVFVVDNAKTLKKTDFNENVVLISNEDTGASGGYGKGMKEAYKMKCFSHFILMDDDTVIEPISLDKVFLFLQFLKPEWRNLCICGGMLFLDNPCIQFEAGGYFDKAGMQKGYGYKYDLSKQTCLASNENDENEINYGAWWLTCFPIKCLEDGNYPVPFFIKYDDVEYSLRCNLKTISLNGFGVWHEKFENKYNTSVVYYNTRNYLHLCRMYCDNFTNRKAKKEIIKRFNDVIYKQQYKMAEAILFAYRDYKKGLDYLNTINQEENHIEISKLNYVALTMKQIKDKYGIIFSTDDFEKTNKIEWKPYMKILLYGQLIPNLFNKKNVVTDIFFDKKEMYYHAKTAVHWNRELQMGYVTQKSFINFIKLYILLLFA